ncbi:sulfatase-like hydrolase/transferase [Lignipirellula cremea]|uniref:Arylsulfatase n=1 Tax=Lignipirellula cremea TaxID=2528010 RepID=A0A518DRW2_9BACT|nr:sulfatase-like hydrolase/transferase [Lignipirellula cremea]QDU94571.1 Arylsulfatase [Lignipirellula cremea]
MRTLLFSGRLPLATAALFFLAIGFAQGADQAKRPPNFLLFLADDLSAKHTGCYGNETYQTPHIDALARQGMRFETCWATPICSPTRAEILTGRYDVRTGWKWLVQATFMCTAMPESMMLEKHHRTYPQMLQAAGYRTLVTGKWMLQGTNQHPMQQLAAMGFDEHCIWPIHSCYLPPEVGYQGPSTKFSRYWSPVLLSNGKLIEGTAEQYGPDLIAEQTIDFIRRHRDEPFCIHYCEMLPHLPAPPTPHLTQPGKTRPGSLKGNIEYADAVLGRLVAALEEMGLRDNTIILFTGDNGTPKYGKGSLQQEEGVRVPLVVSCPGMIPEGVATRQLVDFSDMMPTLLALAGAKVDPGYEHDGSSFAPLLRGEEFTGRPWIYGSNGMLRTDRWLLDGKGQLWDCGDRRDEKEYRDMTGSADPAAQAAQKEFDTILQELRTRKR